METAHVVDLDGECGRDSGETDIVRKGDGAELNNGKGAGEEKPGVEEERIHQGIVEFENVQSKEHETDTELHATLEDAQQ